MISLTACLGCEAEEICNLNGVLSARPQLCLETSSVGWGSGDFGRGVLVGMTKLDGVGIKNGGRETLRFSNLSTDGAAFSVQQPPPAEVPGGGRIFLNLVFAPQETGRLEGRLNIESNAENFSIRTISLFACAETRDGGFSCDR